MSLNRSNTNLNYTESILELTKSIKEKLRLNKNLVKAEQALLQMQNVVNELRTGVFNEIHNNIKLLQEQMIADEENYADEAVEESNSPEPKADSSTELLSVTPPEKLIWVDAPTFEENGEISVRFVESPAEDTSTERGSPNSPFYSPSSSFFAPAPKRPATPYHHDLNFSSSTEVIDGGSLLDDSDEPALPRQMERANAILGFSK